MSDEALAKKMIEELTELGYTPDEMIRVFRLAKKIFNEEKEKLCKQ